MFSPAEIVLISFALASDSIVSSWFSGALHGKLKLKLDSELSIFHAAGRVLFLAGGLSAGSLLTSLLTDFTVLTGLSVLSIVGIKLMVESIRFNPEERVFLLDNYRTKLLVTIAGSINTLFAGMGLGIAGTGLFLPVAVTLPVAAGMSFIGIKAGIRYGYRPVVRYSGLLSGALILFLALRHFVLYLI